MREEDWVVNGSEDLRELRGSQRTEAPETGEAAAAGEVLILLATSPEGGEGFSC